MTSTAATEWQQFSIDKQIAELRTEQLIRISGLANQKLPSRTCVVCRQTFADYPYCMVRSTHKRNRGEYRNIIYEFCRLADDERMNAFLEVTNGHKSYYDGFGFREYWLGLHGSAPAADWEEQRYHPHISIDNSSLQLDYLYKHAGNRCEYCGQGSQESLNADHIMPVHAGGLTFSLAPPHLELDTNFSLLCMTCNKIKSCYWPGHGYHPMPGYDDKEQAQQILYTIFRNRGLELGMAAIWRERWLDAKQEFSC